MAGGQKNEVATKPKKTHSKHVDINTPLTRKEALFVMEYVANGHNATQAYMTVFKTTNKRYAATHGSKMKKKCNIQNAIQLQLDAAAKALQISADLILAEMHRLAFHNAKDYYDDQGNLKPVNKLTREQAACISEIKEEMFIVDGQELLRTTYKLADKFKYLDKLGSYLQLFDKAPETLNITNNIMLVPNADNTDGWEKIAQAQQQQALH